MFENAKAVAQAQEKLKSAETEIAHLKSRLDVAIKERVEAGRKAQELQEKLDALSVSTEKIAALEGERDAAVAAKTKAELDLANFKQAEAKEIETKVQQAIIDRCASVGIEPIKRDNQAGLLEADGDGTMSRKDFEALSPGAARQFIRQGGRVTR
jgi:chromosome segregation ATPase